MKTKPASWNFPGLIDTLQRVDTHSALDFRRLKRCSLFGGVSEGAFEVLRPYIRHMAFDTGECVVVEGEVNDRIYFIETGSVEVAKRISRGAESNEKRLTVMKSGDTFGEMELIDIQPCAASVRTLEPTETLSLSNRDLYKISRIDMKTYALLVMNLAREISRRLRRMDEIIVGADNSDP